MTEVSLSPGRHRTLTREASGSRLVLQQLCRESLAREWLKKSGIPSWRNPLSPPADFGDSQGRYSIMLADGSRLMVCGSKNAVISFDSIAAAKCFAVLSVTLEDHCRSGKVKGFLLLKDIKQGIHSYDLAPGNCRSPLSFVKMLKNTRGYWRQLLKFSARLLILGEPDAPVHGANGAPDSEYA